jgi:hypothetical protein
MSSRWIASASALAGVALIAVNVLSEEPSPPKGCAPDNVGYYFDERSGELDVERMQSVDWIPASAWDSAAIIGCIPGRLYDPTADGGIALAEYNREDGVEYPLPIFGTDGALVAYFVPYRGSVPVDVATNESLVPKLLLQDPPEPTDFDPAFFEHQSEIAPRG